jgi:diketogulonate reductase-like aldo/keto reductase
MGVVTLPQVQLPAGETIPALGQGTWHLGQGHHDRTEETAALRTGIDLGMTVIDTAEMYGGGASEELVGEAISGRRDEVFVVSKVLPSHASREATIDACRASLRRLRIERLDLYLLHWRAIVPLEETVSAFGELRAAGLIRFWGVSNFDLPDLRELAGLGAAGDCQTDQVLYNLNHRSAELRVLPWCRQHGLPIMAYSPLDQGRLLDHPVVRGIATQYRTGPAEVAIAWLLTQPEVCAIPQAGTVSHVRHNRAAADLELREIDLIKLDEAFPPPLEPQPLEML